MSHYLSSLIEKINRTYKEKNSWRDTGKEYGITGGMAYRIVKEGYEPKNPHTRHLLGLPALIPAPACPRCGNVHVTKYCTASRKQPTRWADYPIDELRKALEQRVEM